MGSQGIYAQILQSNTPDVGALLNVLLQNYVTDKIGIKYFNLDANTNSLEVDFGVNEQTADVWNSFLGQEVFQAIEHKYTPEEALGGFSLLIIYTNNGGLFNEDFSNVAFEIPMNEQQLPASILFTDVPLVEEANDCIKTDESGNAISEVPDVSQEGNRILISNDTNVTTLNLFMIPNSVWNDPNLVPDFQGASLKQAFDVVLNLDGVELNQALQGLGLNSIIEFYLLIIQLALSLHKEKNIIINTIRNSDCSNNLSTIIQPCIDDVTVASWTDIAASANIEMKSHDFGSFQNESYACLIAYILNGNLDTQTFSNLKMGVVDELFELNDVVLENDNSLKLKYSTDFGDTNVQNTVYLTNFNNLITGTQFTLTRTGNTGSVNNQLSNTNYPLKSGAPFVLGGSFNNTGTTAEMSTAGLDGYMSFNEYKTNTGNDGFNLVTFNCDYEYSGEFSLKIGTNNGNTNVDAFKGIVKNGIITDLEYLGMM